MKTTIIKFRDKTDIRPLPPIPENLVTEMHKLVDTKINGSGLSLFDKLGAVYAFMDKYNTFVSTFAVCQKGCAHCCKIDVSISQLEAEYISATGGPTLDRGKSRTKGHDDACPFLANDGACSIYDRRPFNCRTFHTLDDPKYCADGKEDHQVYGSSGTGYGVTFFIKLAEWLNAIHVEHDLPYRDIRDWFPSRHSQSFISRLLGRNRSQVN